MGAAAAIKDIANRALPAVLGAIVAGSGLPEPV